VIKCKCGGHYKDAKGGVLLDQERKTAGCSICDGEILISDLNSMRDGAVVDPKPVNVVKSNCPEEHKSKTKDFRETGKIVVNNPKAVKTLDDYQAGKR